MPSPEHHNTPEQNLPRWEMDLSWSDLLVAVLERKVITLDTRVKSLHGDSYVRRFRTASGDDMEVWAIQFRGDDGHIEDSAWRLNVSPSVNSEGNDQSRTPYGLSISRPGADKPYGPYEAKPIGSDISLSTEATEALLSTVVTMVPISEAEHFDDYLQRRSGIDGSSTPPSE